MSTWLASVTGLVSTPSPSTFTCQYTKSSQAVDEVLCYVLVPLYL